MQPELKETWPGVRLLGAEEVCETMREKFNDGEHWLLIVHGSAALLLIEIEDRFYSGEKNQDFTAITTIQRGEVFGLVAAAKKHMLQSQLLAVVRQYGEMKISERELLQRDVFIIAPDEVMVTAALLASKLLSIEDLAMQP